MIPVAMAAQFALGLVQGPLTKILDSYVSDVELRRRLAAEIEQQTLAYAALTAEAGAEVVMAEVQSEHWLSYAWRPVLMLVLMGFLLLAGLILPLADLIAGHRLPFAPRWDALPQGFWDFLTIGMGGYIGGRSLEKVAGTVAAAVSAVPRQARPAKQRHFPFIPGSARKG